MRREVIEVDVKATKTEDGGYYIEPPKIDGAFSVAILEITARDENGAPTRAKVEVLYEEG